MRSSWILSCLTCITLASCTLAQTSGPLTVAESSDFRATARYDDVTAFIHELADRSPLVRVGELGTTAEGRSIPLLILADPPVETPEQARKSGKLIVFAFGNIHAGEVCGKEALLMLAREMATTEKHPLLNDLIVVLAPIYNADGNERMSPDHRPGQVGPEEGMGQRANAEGFDLNRDYVKLESPEARALVRFYNKWDPAVIIDTHTTDGSHHQYTLTYASPRNLAGDPDVLQFVRDTMLPEISKRLESQTGYKSFFYGNFIDDHTVWAMHLGYPAVPRYGTVYNGMRNRIAILSEAYAYATYKDRVLSTRDFVRLCFEYAAEKREHIRGLIDEARKRSIRAGKHPQPDDLVSIRGEPAAFDEPVDVLGYVEVEKDGKSVATDEKKTYRVKLVDRVKSTLDVRRPYAYILPPGEAGVVEKLQQHGIGVDELREDIELDVEVYRVDKIDRAKRAFQKHRMVSVEASSRVEPRMIPAGSVVVRTGQEHAALLIHLLEPESQDGLCTWNFFDDDLAEGADFPVVRLIEPVALLTTPARPLPEDRTLHQRITFERLYESDDRPNLSGSPHAGQTWLDDGAHYLESREGALWKVDAVTGRAELFFDSKKLADALAALPTIDDRAAGRLANRRRLSMNPARTAALFNHENDLYYATLDGAAARRLTTTPQRESRTTFSPDGRFVAFIRDYDLFVVDVETGTERALTTGGNESVRNGQFDWVYAEELYRHGSPAYWWSPDSTHIAFLQIDDRPVHRFTVINEIPVRQNTEVSPYPKAGDPNPTARLGIVSAAGGSVGWVDLGGYQEGGYLITRVGFKPDSRQAWFYVQDRAQTWLDFNVVAPRGGSPKRLFRETTEAWVSNTPPTWLADGSLLYPSERTGWRHLYHYDADGSLVGAVTSGEWEMRRVNLVDEEGGWVYFTGTKDSHIQSHLYRVHLDGDGLERLTAPGSSHRVNLDPTGMFFIDSWSNHASPAKVALFRTSVRAGVSSRRSPVRAGVSSRRSPVRAGVSPRRSSVRAGVSSRRSSVRAGVSSRRSPVRAGVSSRRSSVRAGVSSRRSPVRAGVSPRRSSVRAGVSSRRSSPEGQSLPTRTDRAGDSPALTGGTGSDRLVRTLDTNPVRDLEAYDLGRLRMVQIEMSDGFLLEGSILTPPDFDPSVKHPVWFMTYGGPHTPTISDSWSRRRGWDEMLANMGIVVFRCDPRSAGGKGVVATWTAYRQCGVPELKDIVEAIEWLEQKPYVDPERIGMSGHSYGGFMTAFAMTHSEVFSAGIAGSPVTDWRNYDTIYTERYMDTPQENPEGYDATSVVKAAKNLHGHLLILHGVMDDNVHMQNTLQLVYELEKADKQFELMMYPRSRHGLFGKHYNRLRVDFIRRTMGVGEGSEYPAVKPANLGNRADAEHHAEAPTEPRP